MASFMSMIPGMAQDKGPERFKSVFTMMKTGFWEDVHKKHQHPASNPKFHIFFGVMIMLNAVVIGLEVDMGRGSVLKDRYAFFFFDIFFSVVFFIEMLMRQNMVGWDYFLNPWNAFDYVLVVMSCVDLSASLADEDSMPHLRILRLLRLLRVVRNIKGIRMFRELWMIIQGLIDALRTIGWVVLLLVMILYCASVVITTSVGQSEHVKLQWASSQQYVGTVYRSMWTLVQVITFDGWATDITRPMAKVVPAMTWVILAIIVVCTFGLLNVIIAVMVERTLAIAKENQLATSVVLEETEKEILMSMADDFFALDQDGNGELDFEEYKMLIRSPIFGFKLRLLGIFEDEAEGLFELMDADASGSVSPEEFIAGLQKLKGPAKGCDLVQLISFSQLQCSRAAKYCGRIEKLNAKAEEIQQRLHNLGKGLTVELRDRQQANYRKDHVLQLAVEREALIGTLDANRRLKFPAMGKQNSASNRW